MRVSIYVEGGGGGRDDLRGECRRAFRLFFERAGLKGQMPPIYSCGSRGDAFKRFCKAVEQAGPDDFPILLVDSEGPVRPDHAEKPWDHLSTQDRWPRPAAVIQEQATLMVQCMESWFLADRDGLIRYFGSKFKPNTLPGHPNIEDAPKDGVLKALKDASRDCQKGQYSKHGHSFQILALLEPSRVESASAHARRLLRILREKADLAAGP